MQESAYDCVVETRQPLLNEWCPERQRYYANRVISLAFDKKRERARAIEFAKEALRLGLLVDAERAGIVNVATFTY